MKRKKQQPETVIQIPLVEWCRILSVDPALVDELGDSPYRDYLEWRFNSFADEYVLEAIKPTLAALLRNIE